MPVMQFGINVIDNVVYDFIVGEENWNEIPLNTHNITPSCSKRRRYQSVYGLIILIR